MAQAHGTWVGGVFLLNLRAGEKTPARPVKRAFPALDDLFKIPRSCPPAPGFHPEPPGRPVARSGFFLPSHHPFNVQRPFRVQRQAAVLFLFRSIPQTRPPAPTLAVQPASAATPVLKSLKSRVPARERQTPKNVAAESGDGGATQSGQALFREGFRCAAGAGTDFFPGQASDPLENVMGKSQRRRIFLRRGLDSNWNRWRRNETSLSLTCSGLFS